MRFVLIHGWGFHAGIFADLIGHLDGAETTLIDLGFVSGGPKAATKWPSDTIAIGHSLGLLWLLEQGGGRFRGLVSIQGFDCFCCGTLEERSRPSGAPAARRASRYRKHSMSRGSTKGSIG